MQLKELQLINDKIKTFAKKRHFYYGRFIPNTKFMFVAEMPTSTKKTEAEDWDPTDNFNISHSDKKFFQILNENGFGGSYITDLVKISAEPRRPTEKELLAGLPLLAEELKCIKPDMVIAVSKDTYNTLNKNKEYLNIKNLECIWHPSYVQRYNKWNEYEKSIRELFTRCSKCCII